MNSRVSITPQGEKLENMRLDKQWDNIDWVRQEATS